MNILLLREGEGHSPIIEIAEKDRKAGQPDEGLFCKFCGRSIASLKDAIEVDGFHHHTFFNPAGVVYEIRCFKYADGCAYLEEYSTEFSWFAGYSWSITFCRGCSAHMGWYFSSADLGFFGLIAANLSK